MLGKQVRTFLTASARQYSRQSRPVLNKGLYSSPLYRSFSTLTVVKKGMLMKKISKLFSSRAGLYRFLIVCAGIHISYTLAGTMLVDREVMMAVSDYYANVKIKENETLKVYGVIKPKSLQLKAGSTETRFVISDFQNEIEVVYNGMNKFEFKEGETVVITGYIPDISKKNRMVCVEYMTKHSMEVENWKDTQNLGKPSYGLSTGSNKSKSC